MNWEAILRTDGLLWSPSVFGVLIALATGMVWLALRPTPAVQQVRDRLDDYLGEVDIIIESEMSQPFSQRVLVPLFRRLLRALSRLAPTGNIEQTEQLLSYAGNPGRLSALDFFGLRLLTAVILPLGYLILATDPNPVLILVLGALGYYLPRFWLKRRVSQRQWEVARALPDALDMMTIGVEAGLAFESAMYRVGDKWDNALTRELRRAVTEMRVGAPRDVALERMAERLGVSEINAFVTVLIQSNKLGMSIADVLHNQADMMRVKRRQRAEELARQAGGKMVFPLVLCFIPALFVVILGPAVPDFAEFFSFVSTQLIQ